MEGAARAAAARGATDLAWTVLERNEAALAFFDRPGARRRQDLRLMSLPVGR
jgi:hypothetical protein